MSQFSLDQLKSWELNKWKFPKGLASIVLQDVEQLKKVFEVSLLENPPIPALLENQPYEAFDIYAVNENGLYYRVAYGCNQCKKIVIGNPRIEVPPARDWTIHSLEFYCANCNQLMK